MHRKINLLNVSLVSLVLVGLAASASAQTATRIYWTEWNYYSPEDSRIARANVDGSGIETVLDGFNEGAGCKDLVIDSDAGKLYFANPTEGLIERSNLDGSGRETVVEGINPVGLALDLADGKIYWSNYTYNDPCIRRASLDGADIETLAYANDGCSLEGIVLDPGARHVYFAERMTQHIKRCNMDGGGTVLILACWEGVGHPRGLALRNGRIYWTSDEAIYSATLAGDDVQPFVTDLPGDPYSLELDAEAGQLYWVLRQGMVQRINMNGTGLETLVSGLLTCYGLALEMGGTTPAPDAVPPVVQLGNYPNPFNPGTQIAFELAQDQMVRLQVYGLDGALVGTLIDGPQEAGRHTVRWDGRDSRGLALPSGIYFARLVSGDRTARHKMVLMK
jgi:hypothetical protein